MSNATATDWFGGVTAQEGATVRWSTVDHPPVPQQRILTKTQLADAVGLSTRTLDKHLGDEACRTAIGAYKTSGGRNSHWRFPATAPDRLCIYLQQTRRGPDRG